MVGGASSAKLAAPSWCAELGVAPRRRRAGEPGTASSARKRPTVAERSAAIQRTVNLLERAPGQLDPSSLSTSWVESTVDPYFTLIGDLSGPLLTFWRGESFTQEVKMYNKRNAVPLRTPSRSPGRSADTADLSQLRLQATGSKASFHRTPTRHQVIVGLCPPTNANNHDVYLVDCHRGAALRSSSL